MSPPRGGTPVPHAVALWALPAAVMAVALAVHGHWPVAIGVGLAAGLSLSGSV